MSISKRELEAARDALIRHKEIWERTDDETILVFQEMIRQVCQEAQTRSKLN